VNALVVGASRGIGLGFVKYLLGDDNVAGIVAGCRNPESASELVEFAGSDSQRLRVLPLEVTEETAIAAAAAVVASEFRRLDLLINCAGVLHDGGGLSPERRIAEIDPGNLLSSFAVHAVGPALLAKHFSPLFDREDRAVFASLSARLGSIGDNRLGGWYGYRASKAAHNMILRTLSIELRRRHRGLICASLHPGTVNTALSLPFQQGVPGDRLFSVERAVDQLIAVIDGFDAGSNGRFYAWDGEEIPW
jgi:NAD(P)-dependent dehydrogenase (short-subunit alcohol dehydrogenase family)